MMKKIFLAALACLILNTLAGSNAWAQLSKSNISQYAQRIDLYDERGYEKNGNVTVDGNLVISESNGNASYVYPISKSTIDGYPLDVTLTYNGAVAMTSFAINRVVENEAGRYWEKINQNRPAWIIGVNGFAVQALTSLQRFHNWIGYWTDPPSSNPAVLDNKCLWAIDGYDFCNRMDKFSYSDNLGNSDKILLLRADGSLLELRNVMTVRDLITGSYNNLTETSLQDPRLYTGNYIPVENNSSAHGIVSYDDTYWPDYWKNKVQAASYPEHRPRVLRYYPGDGLEYVFREIVLPYGSAPYDIAAIQFENGPPSPANTHHAPFGKDFAGPTIFYLEEINSSTRNLTTFARSRHYPDDDPNNYDIDCTSGRALTTGFHGHAISYGDNNLSIEAYGKTTRLKFTAVRSGTAQTGEPMETEVSKMPLASYGYDTYVQKSRNPYYYAEYFKNADFWVHSDGKWVFAKSKIPTTTAQALPDPKAIYHQQESYNSYIGLITEIIDPEYRSTKFTYEKYLRSYTGFDFPRSPSFSNPIRLDQTTWRLKQVIELTDSQVLTYEDGPNNTATVPFQLTGYWSSSPLTNNVVKKVEKMSNANTLLHTTNYQFSLIVGSGVSLTYPLSDFETDPEISIPSDEDKDLGVQPQASAENRSLEAVWKSTINTTDNISGLSTQKEIFFHRYNAELRRSIHAESGIFGAVTPMIISLTIPRKTIVTAGAIKTTTIENYRRVAQNLYLPSFSKTTVVQGTNPPVVKSMQTIEYTLTTPLRYGNITEVADLFGKDIATQKVTSYYWPPAVTNPVIYTTQETEYQHLPIVDLAGVSLPARVDSLWQRVPTQQQTAALRLLGTEQTNNVFSLTNLQLPYLPPLYRLVKKQVIKDNLGATLTGKEYSYLSPTNFTQSYDQYRRGALVSEKLIGQGGLATLTPKTLEYTGGHFPTFRNLLKSTVNILDAREEYFYDYKLPELGGGYPTGKMLKNDGTIANKKLYNDFRLFDAPLAKKTYVRKWSANGSLDFIPLTEYYERSYFNMPYGLVTASVDANGWYSRFNYDWSGRLQRAWLPMDFPATSSGSGVYSKNIRLYGRTESYWVVNKCTYSSIPNNRVSVSNNYEQNGSLFDPKTIVVQNPISELLTVPFSNQPDPVFYPTSKTSDGTIRYVVNKNDALHQVSGDKKIFLRLHVASLVGDRASLTVTAYPFSSEPISSILIEGPKSRPLTPDWTPSSPTTRRPQRGTPIDTDFEGVPDYANYYMYIPLPDALISYIRDQLYSNEEVEFRLELTNTEADPCRIEFSNDADDSRPALVVNGTFPTGPDISSDDFTLAYKYDDYDLRSTVFSKVDHINRSANPAVDFPHVNPVTGNNGNSRYTDAFHDFGVDYQIRRSVKQGLETTFDYTGLGQLKTETEVAVGLTNQTTYDELGRPLTLTHADNTTVANAYEIKDPASVSGLSGDEYYGVCSIKTVTDEKGIQTVQYFDAFDRLRKEVQDAQGTQITVKYEYDKLNRLVQVINPNLQQTTYVYDEFGRVKSKSHVDLGTTSYAYDKLGNVRFSQSQKQHESNKVSFFQYDDLNRVTVIGEATLKNGDDSPLPPNPATRLTDWLDPNILHNSAIPDMLTANATMFLSTSGGGNPPVSFNPLDPNFLTLCYPADYATNQRKTVDLLGEPLPLGMMFIKHPASAFPVVNTGYTSNPNLFENISANAQFVQIGMWYDELPASSGGIWAHFPSNWGPMAPTGMVRNLKGRLAAIAYRSHGSEPYHFVVYSYDERGRVEAQLRFTENLGFDAVYYKYNSMDQVISITTADPMQQHTTWYATDNFGRVRDVSTALSTVNQGLIAPPGAPSPYMYPMALSQPSSKDIAYVYNNRGLVGTMQYPGIGTSVDYGYNARKWLTSLTAMNGLIPVFSQTLGYDDPVSGYDGRGQIWSQTWQHGTQPVATQTYDYDNVRRLTEWQLDGRRKDSYFYDKVGNRMQVTDEFGVPMVYTYDPGRNRLTNTMLPSEICSTAYDANGAMIMRETRNLSNVVKEKELLEYTSDGLLRLYHREVNNFASGNTRQWYYRYSGAGEREQKRMSDMVYTGNVGLPAPDGESIWVYYALGADGRQHAVYHGSKVQREECFNGGVQILPNPYVYFYPTEYLTYGSGATANITMKRTANNMWTKEYKIQDQLGSTRVVLDATGNVIGTYDYEPFGKVQPGPGPEQRLSWIDKEKDKESDLGDFGVRKYDEGLGRFMSVDALWENFRAWTPYHYSYNNPLIVSDPNGYFGIPEHARITEKALTGILPVHQIVAINFVQGIHDTYSALPGGYYQDFQHFDNETFAQGWSFATEMQQSDNLADLAKGIHAVQDFYAHSNFVELSMQYFGKETDMTFDNAMKDEGFKQLWEKEGTSGYYPNDTTPDGKIPHGDHETPGLAKDHTDHPLFPKAAQLAERHTADYVREWLRINASR